MGEERWYIESQSEFLVAHKELVVVCMAMHALRESMASAGTARMGIGDQVPIGIKIPPQFRPLTLDLDSGDEEFFMDSDRDKDLSSPDSNDSGIQADAQSFRLLTDDGLYGVVNKPKQKVISSTNNDCGPAGSTSLEEATRLIDLSDEVDGCPQNVGTKTEDPYSMVEEEEEEGDPSPYAVAQSRSRAVRIVEPAVELANSDDDGGNDGNGNHLQSNYSSSSDGNDDTDKLSDSSDLPEGWQKHRDEQGSYYWHIKSGITQREPPSPVLQKRKPSHVPNTKNPKTNLTASSTDVKLIAKSKENTKCSADANVKLKPGFEFSSANRFLVRCLGSVPLAEEELTDDRSGLTINQCISSLAHRPGVLQNGELQGRDLYLEFNGDRLLLTDARSDSTVNSHPVRSVRVWGVGREKDSRDFAYISRDPASERHVCWVFKCERTGHEVASALRNVCYRILKENKNSVELSCENLASSGNNRLVYDSHITHEGQKNRTKNEHVVFPVPMSETKKVINCHYLGMMKVPKPIGMDVLNDAIEMIYAGVPSSKWVSVAVEVAPSAVTVYDRGAVNSIILECRIRFLTFLGICINNCRLCAFIMHSAQNEFFAHVFHCLPDAGSFCRTIKAACKLRYQKCLDAQTQREREKGGKTQRQTTAGSSIPFQGLKESLQKGVNNFFGGYNKNQQHKG